jgi:hypothetical protein
MERAEFKRIAEYIEEVEESLDQWGAKRIATHYHLTKLHLAIERLMHASTKTKDQKLKISLTISVALDTEQPSAIAGYRFESPYNPPPGCRGAGWDGGWLAALAMRREMFTVAVDSHIYFSNAFLFI